MGNASAAVVSTVERKIPSSFDSQWIVANGKTIWPGTLIGINAAGNLLSAGDATCLAVVGIAQEKVVGDGVLLCRFTQGSVFRIATGANAATIANRGQAAYCEDDQSVGTLSTTGLFAGVIYDVDSTGTYVFIGAGFVPPGFVAGAHPLAVKVANYTVQNGIDADALLQSATDAVQFTLPASAAANKGMEVTLQNTGAATAVEIQVLLAAAGDKIYGTVMAVSAGAVAGHGMKNTKATSKQGDYLRLRSDGAGGWWIVGGMGVWASL